MHRMLSQIDLEEDLRAAELSVKKKSNANCLAVPEAALKQMSKKGADDSTKAASSTLERLLLRGKATQQYHEVLDQIVNLQNPLDTALAAASSQLGFCEAGGIYCEVSYPFDYALKDILTELAKKINFDIADTQWPSRQKSLEAYRHCLFTMPNIMNEEAATLQDPCCWPDVTQDEKDIARDTYIINGAVFEGNSGIEALMNYLSSELQNMRGSIDPTHHLHEASTYQDKYSFTSSNGMSNSYERVLALMLSHLASRTFTGGKVFDLLLKYFYNPEFAVIRPVSADAKPSRISIIPSAGFAIINVHYCYSIHLLENERLFTTERDNKKLGLTDSSVTASRLSDPSSQNDKYCANFQVYYTALIDLSAIKPSFIQTVENHLWNTQKSGEITKLLALAATTKAATSHVVHGTDTLSENGTYCSQDLQPPLLHQKVYICK